MLRLALEIPTSQLKRLAPLVDLDFVLAHKILVDEEYATFFRNRPRGRELILDNSTHEFGTPLPMQDLRHAAFLCSADLVVAPDIIPRGVPLSEVQYWQNIQWMKDASEGLQPYDVAAVLCGTSKEERDVYIAEAAQRTACLCFTFHDENRLQWWKDFASNSANLEVWDRIHILGVNTLEELERWVDISEAPPFKHLDFSVDTTKPVKWGAQGKRLDELKTLRGGPIDAKAVLDLPEFSLEQLECTEYNINLLKKICRGGA